MITQLKIANFRGHDGEYTFGPGKNYIKGKNEAGKSSIKEAIAFLWMGTDSEGAKSPDHLISVGCDFTQVDLSTPKSTLKRRKKRGTTAEIKVCREGLPDIKITQTDLMSQVHLSHEVFMSSWCVGYFMKMKSEQRVKVLGEVARIDRRELLSNLLPTNFTIPAVVKLVNPRIDADAIAGLRRQEQNKKEAATAQLDGLKRASAQGSAITIDAEAHKARVSVLEAELEEVDLYSKLNSKYADYVKKVNHLSSELNILEKDLSKLTDVDSSAVQEHRVHAEKFLKLSTDLDEEMQNLVRQKKTRALDIPKKPSAQQGDCPTCHQPVGKEHIEALLVHYNKELEAYNIHEREVESHNQKLSDAYNALTAKKTEAKKNHTAHLEAALKIEKDAASSVRARNELVARIDVLKGMLEAEERNAPPQPTAAPARDIQALRNERDRLKGELHTHNTFASQSERLRLEMGGLEGNITDHTSNVQMFSELEAALRKLPELETQKTLETARIPGIKLSLVDGELVVTNEAGVDYRCLSDGRRTKVDVALCMAIKRAAGPSAPPWIFVDNSDLVDELILPDGTQCLVAEVTDDQEVEILSL